MSDTLTFPDYISDEFKTAIAIYKISQIDKLCATEKLITKEVSEYITKSKLRKCIKFLEAWNIVRVRFLHQIFYIISDNDTLVIKSMYERYCTKTEAT